MVMTHSGFDRFRLNSLDAISSKSIICPLRRLLALALRYKYTAQKPIMGLFAADGERLAMRPDVLTNPVWPAFPSTYRLELNSPAPTAQLTDTVHEQAKIAQQTEHITPEDLLRRGVAREEISLQIPALEPRPDVAMVHASKKSMALQLSGLGVRVMEKEQTISQRATRYIYSSSIYLLLIQIQL